MCSDDHQKGYASSISAHSLKSLIALQEQSYDNIRISKNAWDTNLIKVSRDHLLMVVPLPTRVLGKPRVPLSQLGGRRWWSFRSNTAQ